MVAINFHLNGKEVEAQPGPGEMLSTTLREHFGLTGTKIGCEELECGTCTVLINGGSVLSCVYPTAKARGKEVITIEGLAHEAKLHPLQESFIIHGAVQCGFCIPGQIMAAAALLEKNSNPTLEELRYVLKDTLCRCAGYPTLERAILDAARTLRTGEPLQGPDLSPSDTHRHVGKVVVRPDAELKVTGRAMFSDDYSFPDMLHARTFHAGIPHAIVQSLDVRQARELPGVMAVLTAEDIPGRNAHGVVTYDWPVLVGVGETVRYVGDALALVAAETREIATKALELIQVEFTPLPVVTDPIRSSEPDSTAVHENGNLLKHIKVSKGDIEAGISQSDLVLEDVFKTQMTEQAFLEPECSIAWLTEGGRLEVLVGSQIPYADREQIASTLAIDPKQVRVIGALIGGGFGGKEDIAGQIHAAMLAHATRRPVKILYDRHESLMVHPKRHPTQIRVRMGLSSDGKINAVETELYGDTGAYASLGEKVMTRATTHSSGPYVIPHVKANCYAMYTNNPPAGAFRGFGVTQSAFAIESMMDIAAESLALNPIEFRLKNALQVGDITNTGQRLVESVGLKECIEQVASHITALVDDRDPFAPESVPGSPHLRRAWGVAAAYKNTGLGGGAPDKAAAEVELYADGKAEVRTSSAEIGQGLVTVLQLIAAEELHLPLGAIQVLLSDTDLTPDGGPTTASRQTYMAGNAVRHAAIVLLGAMRTTLAEKYDVPPETIRFIEGLAQVNGTEIGLGDVAGLMRSEGREPKARYEYWAPETKPLGTGGDMHFAYSFSAQAAQVEVDLETGEVAALRIVAATDVGRAINPLGLLGQIEGGVMMGLGNALTEEFILEGGMIFSDRLARYRMPGYMHTPEITSLVIEHPTADGPFGAKGVGEISSIPTTPAITNAIYHACGIRVKKLPVDQDWLALEIKRTGVDLHDHS